MSDASQTQPAALNARPAILRMTLSVTRAATGKKETYEVIGTPVEYQSDQEQKHEHDTSNGSA